MIMVISYIGGALWMPIVLFFLLRREENVENRRVGLGSIFVIMLLTNVFLENELGLLLGCVFIAIVMIKVMKCPWLSLFYIPISYILIVVCNYAVEVAYLKVVNLEQGVIVQDDQYVMWTTIGITILVTLLAFLLEKAMRQIAYLFSSKIGREMICLVGGNILLCAVAFLINGWVTRQNEFTSTVATTNFIIFTMYMILALAISLIVFKVHHEREKMENEKQQFESLQEYTSQIESMYTNLRSFKHDYVNILATLSGYLEAKDYDGMERYFNENILPESHKMTKDNYRLNQLSNIKEKALKGLLSSKLIYAHEIGIDVYIDIMEEIENISMNIMDLTRIMGIYLDNAIEAARESAEKEIRFNVVKEEHSVTLVLMNTFQNKEMIFGKIEQNGYSTKGENRGIGLYNVKELLKRYEHVYKNTSIEDEFFVQTLVIE